MGGLAGLVNFVGEPPDLAVLERMSSALVHRGPDAEGSFVDGPVALSHRRRQLSTGGRRLPVVHEDVVLLLDGNVYDHALLAREFGWFDPKIDSPDVLVEAWRRFGEELPKRVDGHFVLVFWDRRTQTLHLMRDRMGSRPLFWARSGSRFAFASELPALLEVPWVSRQLSTETLAEYLSFRTVHAPRTLVKDVFQLEPAHILRVSAREVESRRYWTPEYAPTDTARPDEEKLISSLQEGVDRAVKRRLIAGVPAAIYLSGGLGSTVIAAAARRTNRPLSTFTIGFADDPNPEMPFAGRVAQLLGLEHHDVIVGSSELAAAFDDAVVSMGHPVGNPAVILQLLFARAVGGAHRIVLSGDGGEELFGGRMLDPLARRLNAARWYQKLPGPTRRWISPLLKRTAAGRAIATPVERYGFELELGGADLFSALDRRGLLMNSALVRPRVRKEVLGPLYATVHTDPVNAVLHAFMRSGLQEESLVRADRTAASAGLEIRFPLLDTEVFAMAAALPGETKLRRVGGALHTRWPLRAMLTGVLPTSLVHRPKRGLPMPLDPWLAGPGRLFFDERFARLQRDPHQLWNVGALASLRRNIAIAPGTGAKVWALFLLDSWMDRFRIHT